MQQQSIKNEHNSCEAMVLQCIDFRLRRRLNEHLMGRFPQGYDLISVAGGVKRLLADGPENNFVLEQLQTSHRLHKPRQIVLIQHEDCGAYGGSKAFSSFESEETFQKEQLAKAEQLLKKHFPSISVEKFLICLSGKLIPVV